MQLSNNYNLLHYFIDWYQDFLRYNEWKQTVKNSIQSNENIYFTEFAISYESVSKNVFPEVTFETFW